MFSTLTARLSGSRGGAVLLGVAAAVIAAILLLVYLNRYRNSVNGDNASTPVLVAKALIPPARRTAVLRSAQRRFVYSDPGAPDEQLMLELRRRFSGEVYALSEYLGRDLVSLWGYDDID